LREDRAEEEGFLEELEVSTNSRKMLPRDLAVATNSLQKGAKGFVIVALRGKGRR
jgi:hypothetical protein